MIVLLDTNILLDVIQDRAPYSASATRVWKLVEEHAVTGFVSAISFNNVYYIARKQAGGEKALDAIRLIRRIFRIVPLDELVIDRALADPGNDFEDAIQAAAAIRISADHLVTRNSNDFDFKGVSAVSAEEFLAIFQA
ncbi:MAG: PIN domain-containing protein [Pirellulales bacterium]|nr:PIN domain-containing protein [Pirellulales bacterium]